MAGRHQGRILHLSVVDTMGREETTMRERTYKSPFTVDSKVRDKPLQEKETSLVRGDRVIVITYPYSSHDSVLSWNIWLTQSVYLFLTDMCL